jgi:hypothetical protein
LAGGIHEGDLTMQYDGLALVERNGHWYFEDPALIQKHDPKGPNYALLDNFKQLNHFRMSQSRLYPKWLALLPRSMRRRQRGYWSRWDAPAEAIEVMENIDDHALLFVRDGRYCYTTQPYDLRLEDYQRLEKYWGDFGYWVDISYRSAWWYPGATPLITISQTPVLMAKDYPTRSSGIKLGDPARAMTPS